MQIVVFGNFPGQKIVGNVGFGAVAIELASLIDRSIKCQQYRRTDLVRFCQQLRNALDDQAVALLLDLFSVTPKACR